MTEQPTLNSERLVLRPFTLADAADVQRLAGDKAIASTTLNIPHPYEDGMAEAWIGTHQEEFEGRKSVTFAVARAQDAALLGAISLFIGQQHQHAELGYWVGKPYWGNGYCTEAARAILDYGFQVLDLNRIYARHLARNPASGRVMIKTGLQYEGCMRQHVLKWDVFEDVKFYGILRSEYAS
jgi:RimJ/RimL family protein N-acetyltransferase